MVWHPSGPQGDESRKIRHLAVHYTLGEGLDVGCGARKLHNNCIGVDSGKQWGRPVADIKAEGDDLSMFADASQDYVFSSHLLEHMVDPVATLKEWWRVIKPGGCMVLYLPHANLYPRCGEPGANPDHKHDFLPRDILQMMREVAKDSGVLVEENEVRDAGNGREKFSEYSFFQVFRKLNTGQFLADPYERPEKSCLVIRYGGYGDALMTASILPQLKREGWHITFNTTPRQAEVLKEDPNIDEFWLQDRDAIPIEEVPEHFNRIAERYDRVINMCESVEVEVLLKPGTFMYERSKEIIHDRCNINYGEYTHRLAGLSYEPNQKFYYKKEEVNPIDTGGRPLVVWQIGGSAYHKSWPYVHNGIVMLLYKSDAFVVISGGPDDVPGENLIKRAVERMYGDASDRIAYRCGTVSPREAMITACESDLVVGPETGILNAVAMRDVPKVIFLSHSSKENLTKHWVNTTEIIPDAPCHPCHKLHHGSPHDPGWNGHCPMDPETGGAACTVFRPLPVIDTVLDVLSRRKDE